MYKLTTSIIFILFLNPIFGQSISDAVFFSPNKQINKFHSIGELEALKKGDLIKIYQDRVEEIMTILPLLSLTNEPGVRLKDIGIKEDSRHVKVLKSNKASTEKGVETIKEAIEELVPYADTEKIIWTILYFEEVIKKMRIGVSGNF